MVAVRPRPRHLALGLLADAQQVFEEAEIAWLAAVANRDLALLICRESGVPVSELQERLGVSRTVIFRLVARSRERHGIPHPHPSPPGVPTADIEEIRREFPNSNL